MGKNGQEKIAGRHYYQNMKKFLTISKCRICGWEAVNKIGSLGNLAINDFPSKWPTRLEKCPLELVLCPKCGLLQLGYIIYPEKLYKNFYWYESGTNPVIVRDLKEIAEQAIKIAKPKQEDVFIDIGANDGTLLSFVPNDYCKIGVEPAKNLEEKLKKHCAQAYVDFWESKKVVPPRAKVITAIGMFYDSEDPNLFISKVKEYLLKDGIFVAQLMTLKPMIENNDVSNICHEHLEYYSYNALKYLFEKNGLEIFKVEENNINGGSYRLFARHYKTGSIDYPEPQYNYKAFFQRLEAIKKETINYLNFLKIRGEKVYAYGASTKGNTLLQYYELGEDLLEGVADVDEKKIGKYTLTGIPIISDKEARRKADYFFILPWGFTEQFIKKEKQLGFKGRFMVSIPNLKIYG
jgi:hypothetical protein